MVFVCNESMQQYLKYILIFFIGLSVLINATFVYSQNPPDPNAIQQAANCGAIGQKCCQPFRFPQLGIPKPNLPGVGVIIDVVNALFSPFVNVVSGGLNVVVDQLKGGKACHEGVPTDNNNLNSCFCADEATIDIANLCRQIKSPAEQQACVACASKGVWTGIGCVDFTLSDFIQNIIFGWGIGFAGVISLFCIMWSAFRMQFSRGDPAQIKASQERMTACITGLILIIFSVFILRFIGVNILRIPGFGT